MGEQTPTHITHPYAEREEVYRKRAHAAQLRREGWDWASIAAEVGYADRATAYNAVKALNDEERSFAYEEVSLYRAEQLERYRDMLRVNWPLMAGGSAKHANVVLRVLTRIDKLTGAEAPIKFDLGEGDVDRALRDLEAEIGRRAAAAQVEAARREGATG